MFSKILLVGSYFLDEFHLHAISLAEAAVSLFTLSHNKAKNVTLSIIRLSTFTFINVAR